MRPSWKRVEKRACLYFYEQAHPVTGLVLDRVRIDGVDDRRIASLAATGYGLSALCIAHQRGYLKKEDAENRVERTLDFFARRAFRQRGFYFHFLDCVSGQRAFNCELSSVDTAWLLCGVLHAREHFDKGRIRRLATEIIERVDWQWMRAEGDTLCHGWTPENGFLPYRWDEYSELLAMYLLAIGSTYASHPSLELGCMDAAESHCRNRRHVRRIARASFRAPILPRMVRFPEQAGRMGQLFSQFTSGHDEASRVLHRLEKQVSLVR